MTSNGIATFLSSVNSELQGISMTHLSSVNSDSVSRLCSMPKLDTLGVSYCRNLGSEFFISLAKAKLKFKDVRMDGCGPLSSEVLAIFEHSRISLTHVSMQSIKFVVFMLIQDKMDVKYFKMVGDCSNVETMDISGIKECAEDTIGNMVGSRF